MANDIIDINVTQTVETVEITVTPNLTTVNINQITGGGGGGGVTNLSTTQTDTNFTINSDTGTDASVPLGNGTLAGATLNDYTTAEKTKLSGIATGAEVNVNADWNATTGDAQILNKPTIKEGVYSYEIHVSQVDGNDTTGTGAVLNPVASITKALTLITGQRKTIIIHPGNYTENISITTQYTVLTSFALLGGNTLINGTITASTGCTVSGLKMTNLNITAPTGTGTVNILNCEISGTLTKSSSADYTLIRFCDIGTTNITSTAGTVAFFGGNPNFITVNNSGARVLVKNCTTIAPVLTLGSLTLADSIIISTTSTSNAITTSASTFLTLANSQIIIPAFNNVARVSLSGFYSILNCVFDKPNSTLVALSGTGGTTNSIVYSQFINADKFIKQGGTSSEILLADGSTSSKITTTSQLTNNGADGVNPFITALDIPVAGQAGTLVREVKNMTGATLVKGTVVYISGANGNKALVSKALATTDALSSRTFGMLQSDILNNGLGNCVIIGDLTGVNTSSFTEGDQLYLSGVTAGTYTASKILAPTHLVYVGKVTRSHPTLGQIEVGVQNGYELEEIHDVKIDTPANNEVLAYTSATDIWENKTPSEAGLQPTLVSATNIKTINGNTILGSGDLTITSAPQELAPFRMLANNSAITAVPTVQVFKDIGEQTYILSPTFTGTAPTIISSSTYKYNQTGSLVTVRVNLIYTTPGSISQVVIPLPADMPTPLAPTGLSGALDILYYGNGMFNTTTTTVSAGTRSCFLRRNATTGYEFLIAHTTAISSRVISLTLQYFTE